MTDAPAPDPESPRRYVSSLVTQRRPLYCPAPQGDLWWPIGWLVRWIRKGPKLRDGDMLPVIDALADTIRMHLLSAQAVLPAGRHDELAALQVRFDAAAGTADEIPDLPALLAIDASINALYPASIAAKRAWMIRERFERVASPHAVEEWRLRGQIGNGATAPIKDPSATEPPTPPADNPVPTATANPGMDTAASTKPGEIAGAEDKATAPSSSAALGVQVMLSYINGNYIMGLARQKAERELKHWLIRQVTSGPFAVLGASALMLLLIESYWSHVPGLAGAVVVLLVMALLGRIGALISISRRLQAAVSGNALQQDVVQELAALCSGRTGIKLAALSGSIFALLAWLLFAGGVPALLGLDKGLFPTPWAAAAPPPPTPASVEKGPAIAQLIQIPMPAPAALPSPTSTALPSAGTTTRPAAPVGNASAKETAVAPEIWAYAGIVSNALGFAAGKDLLLLLLWGFIAGFAERFVPDALDRLVGRSQNAAK